MAASCDPVSALCPAAQRAAALGVRLPVDEPPEDVQTVPICSTHMPRRLPKPSAPCFLQLSPSVLFHRTFSFAGIIAKDPTSLEEEIKEIRRSGSSKALDNTPEFELSDIFYFCRKGMETIMDDEVTKRFSAEELESWNLLSRTNYNFQYISLRLTVLWGLGVLIRYCFLLPLR